MTMQGPQPRNGDAVEWAGLKEFWSTRPYRQYWNRYGESAVMPADPVNLVTFMEQGWTLFEPTHPEERPKQIQMRDGSIFDLDSTANSLSEGERNRLNGTTTDVGQQAGPTATYYSQQGDELPGLPADPESMKQYLEMGLSLTPPKTAEKVTQLKAV